MNGQNENKDESVSVTARIAAKPKSVEKVKAACRSLAESSRIETGCIYYDLFQATNQPNVFIFFEQWKTAVDLENHLASQHAAEFDETVANLLLEDEEIVYLEKLV